MSRICEANAKLSARLGDKTKKQKNNGRVVDAAVNGHRYFSIHCYVSLEITDLWFETIDLKMRQQFIKPNLFQSEFIHLSLKSRLFVISTQNES